MMNQNVSWTFLKISIQVYLMLYGMFYPIQKMINLPFYLILILWALCCLPIWLLLYFLPVSISLRDCLKPKDFENQYDVDTVFYTPSPELLKTKDIACYQPWCKEKNWSKLVFDAGALCCLYTSTALLNDNAINGCVALISDTFPSSEVILFSMYALAAMQNESEPATLWRYTQKLQFWKYSRWIILIHCKH